MNMRPVLLVTFLVFCITSAASAATVYVVTKEDSVREDCRFFAPIKLKVRYGEAIETSSQEGDWFRVTARGVRGCVHRMAIQSQSPQLSGSAGASRGASRDEVALAGKGFNPETEAALRNKGGGYHYSAVDWLERVELAPDRVQKFVVDGGLRQP
jgi:hypothetical protein